MGLPFYLIAARCKNNGIGYKGDLPWSLKKEMQYFGRMTKEVMNPGKKNAVLMGRKTWDSLPVKMKPLPDRFNFVLSTQPLNLTEAIHCTSFEDVLNKLNSPEYSSQIETVWVIGGSKVYEEGYKRDLYDRLYLTEILKEFECDTFLNIDANKGFKEIRDERVPEGVQEEDGVQYIFQVHERI